MAIEQNIMTPAELRKQLLFGRDELPDLEHTVAVIEEINALKREKNAVVLGHWYMRDAVKLVADYLGDSLDLSRQAMETTADIIVFAGVKFMAETAKILNPAKKVILPTLEAGCSLAESITGEDVRRLRAMYPDAAVVTYINTTAEVKAESDVCVTSANAKAIISKLPQRQILFIPDRYMGANLKAELPDKEIITYDGACILHETFTALNIPNIRRLMPGLRVLAHYECDPSIIAAADFHGGTNDMRKYIARETAAAKKSGEHLTFLMATECGLSSTIKSEYAQNGEDIEMVGPCNLCPYMKTVTLHNLRDSLRDEKPEILVPEHVRVRAHMAVEKMFELSEANPSGGGGAK